MEIRAPGRSVLPRGGWAAIRPAPREEKQQKASGEQQKGQTGEFTGLEAGSRQRLAGGDERFEHVAAGDRTASVARYTLTFTIAPSGAPVSGSNDSALNATYNFPRANSMAPGSLSSTTVLILCPTIFETRPPNSSAT